MQSAQLHTLRRRKILRVGLIVALAATAILFFRGILLDTLSVVFGGCVVAFFVSPLARLYEKKLPRSFAALLALTTVLGMLALLLCILLPSLIREAGHLIETLPRSIQTLQDFAQRLYNRISARIPGIELPSLSFGSSTLPHLAANTLQFAGSIADLFYRVSLMVLLGYFFLCDRNKLLIRFELLIPGAARKTAVRMGNAVCRELRLYLRGQGTIAAIVGTLSALALWLVGVDSALMLGLIVGIFNMVPYFGPVLGGIPAVLAALGSGWMTAALAILALWLVQQIDGTLISPRIMSSLTGISPAAVLLALFVGSGLGGVAGMLLALPCAMTLRTVYRIFVQRYENV
ncbi:MAG: AI-2E family transporter [Christensenellales bacterium]|nr:AI-2E family transporter [Christensenellales bacterium]